MGFELGPKLKILPQFHFLLHKMLIFGWVGGIINCLHSFPQMYKIIVTKSIRDISLTSLCIKLLAAVLYMVHGFLINDPPLLYMTLVCVIQYSVLIMQYKYYSPTAKCAANTVVSTTHTTPPKNTKNEDPA